MSWCQNFLGIKKKDISSNFIHPHLTRKSSRTDAREGRGANEGLTGFWFLFSILLLVLPPITHLCLEMEGLRTVDVKFLRLRSVLYMYIAVTIIIMATVTWRPNLPSSDLGHGHSHLSREGESLKKIAGPEQAVGISYTDPSVRNPTQIPPLILSICST